MEHNLLLLRDFCWCFEVITNFWLKVCFVPMMMGVVLVFRYGILGGPWVGLQRCSPVIERTFADQREVVTSFRLKVWLFLCRSTFWNYSEIRILKHAHLECLLRQLHGSEFCPWLIAVWTELSAFTVARCRAIFILSVEIIDPSQPSSYNFTEAGVNMVLPTLLCPFRLILLSPLSFQMPNVYSSFERIRGLE